MQRNEFVEGDLKTTFSGGTFPDHDTMNQALKDIVGSDPVLSNMLIPKLVAGLAGCQDKSKPVVRQTLDLTLLAFESALLESTDYAQPIKITTMMLLDLYKKDINTYLIGFASS